MKVWAKAMAIKKLSEIQTIVEAHPPLFPGILSIFQHASKSTAPYNTFMSETLKNKWSTPSALAIPKEGYFIKEDGQIEIMNASFGSRWFPVKAIFR